jgi:hypothetical protein
MKVTRNTPESQQWSPSIAKIPPNTQGPPLDLPSGPSLDVPPCPPLPDRYKPTNPCGGKSNA